ncbi:YopX family protein [Staphylococcus haemolyticus]|nr:YopX family protein [Staphylococcus haemolyticus]MCH4356074.1 YopX family protein [Staphylococcus haemolyticus]MCH4398389.1 YopX family protein [Staphylococcus haemolyticus]
MKFKFRVWDKEERAMLDVHGINFDAHGIWTNELIDDESDSNFIFLDDVELMQSTGLIDKNGVEIYEGDIVALKYPYDKRIKTKGIIVWDSYKPCFGISMIETTERYELYRITARNYLTVIGNVHQNSELLEDE